MDNGNSAEARLLAAWQGRISGCLLGKPLEVLSFQEGFAGLRDYLQAAGALPLRDYVPRLPQRTLPQAMPGSCRGEISCALADDDINYTVLALLLLEAHGLSLTTTDVARAWLQQLPAGKTWTAERAAYRTLLAQMDDEFVNGAPPGFDLDDCANNRCNSWIGAQIRADLYGWACPGRPALAAELARRDGALSHHGVALDAAGFIAALAAILPDSASFSSAIECALQQVPPAGDVASAVNFAMNLGQGDAAVAALHKRYRALSPIHSLNNLAVVVWALHTAEGDFSTAIGNAVAAAWDTDSNGATVGGLAGIAGYPIAADWLSPWQDRVLVDIAGIAELSCATLAQRTTAVMHSLAATH